MERTLALYAHAREERLFDALKPAVNIFTSKPDGTTGLFGIDSRIGKATLHEPINRSPRDREILHKISLAHQVLFHAGGILTRIKKILDTPLDK